MVTVPIYNARDEIDASLTQGYLASHGIAVQSGQGTESQRFIGAAYHSGGWPLFVPLDEFSEAEKLLRMRPGAHALSHDRKSIMRSNLSLIISLIGLTAVYVIAKIIF
jgi:hypothetical protein